MHAMVHHGVGYSQLYTIPKVSSFVTVLTLNLPRLNTPTAISLVSTSSILLQNLQTLTSHKPLCYLTHSKTGVRDI